MVQGCTRVLLNGGGVAQRTTVPEPLAMPMPACRFAVAFIYGAWRATNGVYSGGQVLSVLLAALVGAMNLGHVSLVSPVWCACAMLCTTTSLSWKGGARELPHVIASARLATASPAHRLAPTLDYGITLSVLLFSAYRP